MAQLKTFEVFYAADHFNIHAVIKATNDANARNIVQKMMENGEAFGMDLAYREVSPCTCSEMQKHLVGCDCQ